LLFPLQTYWALSWRCTDAPNFKAPLPKQPLPAMLTLALEKEVFGQFEVILSFVKQASGVY
jgi:hypothetical protein